MALMVNATEVSVPLWVGSRGAEHKGFSRGDTCWCTPGRCRRPELLHCLHRLLSPWEKLRLVWITHHERERTCL